MRAQWQMRPCNPIYDTCRQAVFAQSPPARAGKSAARQGARHPASRGDRERPAAPPVLLLDEGVGRTVNDGGQADAGGLDAALERARRPISFGPAAPRSFRL